MSNHQLDRIAGYELKEMIGAGAYGAVYRAFQPTVGREVAIKVILPEHANRPDFIRRFEAEAHLVAQLEHLHIVPLYDYWREPDGAYLVMRLMNGGSLKEVLEKRKLDLPEVALLMDQLMAALASAHRKGVVHRDLKPANILLDEEGNAYLSDFGIAKDLRMSQDQTETGTVIGSPGYLSPEQVQSESITPQTDIYSLGVVLYELLVGQHPFQDTPVWALMLKQVSEPLPSILEQRPDLPESLEVVVQRATAKDPAERYMDLNEFANSFRAALGEETLERFMTAEEAAELSNPYKGLLAFQEADANDFFGREALTDQLLVRLQEVGEANRFLAVVGPSGSGKSSVVRAGLIPALREGAMPGSQDWFIVEMVPGAHPFEEMELGLLKVAVKEPPSLLPQLKEDVRGMIRAVRRVLPEGGQLLLLIDQFEELFTLVEDPAEVDFFLDSLYTAIVDPACPLRVVVTLRADFYDRPLMHADFSRLVKERTEVVVPLNPEEISNAIEKPAKRVGAIPEDGLVTMIVADVVDQPGALPLLQYALTELFEQRNGNVLTGEAYASIGGVLGALGQRAEQVYAQLEDGGKETARQLFLRLVTLGEGVEDTRRRVRQSELESILAVNGGTDVVLETFGKARLITFDHDPVTRGPTVEVAHEALLREWPRLREWLDESRADLRMQRVLNRTASEWGEGAREASFLLRGARLEQYAGWLEETDIALSAEELEYLEASMEAKRQRDAEEAARKGREQALEERSRLIFRALAGVFALAAVIATILSVFAFNQQAIAQSESLSRATQQAIAEEQAVIAAQNEAEALAQQAIAESESAARATQQAVAEEQRLLAEQEARAAREAYSLSLAGHAQNALDDGDTGTALMLALAATGLDAPPAEAMRVLRTATYAPGMREQLLVEELFPGVDSQIYSLAASPVDNHFLFGFLDGTLILWDLESRSVLHQLVGHTGKVRDVAFSPDGRQALSGGDDHDVILWDLGAGQEIRRFSGHKGWVFAVTFSPDGRLAASGGLAGDSLLTFSEPGQLFVWDLESGVIVHQVEQSEGPMALGIKDLVFSPDSRSILISYGVFTDSSFEFWLVVLDALSGQMTLAWETQQDNFNIAISPDGSRALTASSDDALHFWDLENGQEISTLAGHPNLVTSVSYSPDGTRILSADWNGRVMLWDAQKNTPIMHVRGHQVNVPWIAQDDLPVTAVFTSDARQALSVAGDGTVMLWDLIYAGDVRHFSGPTDSWLTSVAFSPDGQHVFTGSGLFFDVSLDNTIKMWEIETGSLVRVFDGHMHAILPMALNQDGSLLLSGSQDGTIKLWDVGSGSLIRSMDAHSFGVFAVDISPDGKRAVSGPVATGDDMIIWDLETGEALHRIPHENENTTIIKISPDGQTAFTRDDKGQLAAIDLDSGEWKEVFATDTGFDFAFNPKGDAVYIVFDRVFEWNLNTDSMTRILGEIPSARSQVEITSDGSLLLTSNHIGDLFLWDVESGQELYRFHSDVEQWLMYLDIDPSGKFAVSPAGNNSAILWDLTLPIDPEEIHTWITENRFLREPTCQERLVFSLLPLCEQDAD